jgi:DNA-binding XRE family transcriptional regulator
VTVYADPRSAFGLPLMLFTHFIVVNCGFYGNMLEETPNFYEMSLSDIREYRGFKRRELSLQLGIHENTLYLIETRKSVPRVDLALSIAVALKISLKQFVYSIGLDPSDLPDDLPAAR